MLYTIYTMHVFTLYFYYFYISTEIYLNGKQLLLLMIRWEYKLHLWTLILMGKFPSLCAVSLSTLFFWRRREKTHGKQLWTLFFFQCFHLWGLAMIINIYLQV